MRKKLRFSRKLCSDRSGNMAVWAVILVLAILFMISGVSVFFNLTITAAGVKDATESAVISVINDNYNEVYHSVREGYAAGYEPMRGSFRFSVDKGDVAGRLAYLLGLDEAANVLISTNGNETEYRIKDIKVQITNNRLASGSGTYSATVTLTLEIPVRFGGKEIANLPIFMRVKAAYRERF